jgi:hypothetical protein
MSVTSIIYEVVYGVDLLDDLHNYFPALLYSQSRFITLTHVFHYVRHQMNRYFPGGAATTAATTAARVQASLGEASIILSLLGHIGAGGAGGAAAAVPFSAPVIVAPTAEQLDSGSEIVTDLSGASPCAVCQDALIPNDICRRLRACGHVYHRSCIDQWYQRSVRCPTCRHDIRNPLPAAGSPLLAAAAERAAVQPNDTVVPLELPPPL